MQRARQAEAGGGDAGDHVVVVGRTNVGAIAHQSGGGIRLLQEVEKVGPLQLFQQSVVFGGQGNAGAAGRGSGRRLRRRPQSWNFYSGEQAAAGHARELAQEMPARGAGRT